MKIVRTASIILVLLFASTAWASTYYIDYDNGNDSNNGLSKSVPWKHQPYMKGFTGSYVHQAGDIFVFKGGVTWAYSAADPVFPMIIKTGGATGNPDQYTVDKTWFAGTSYTPPVFDGCQTAEGLNVCGLNGAATLGKNSWLISDNNGQYSVSNIIINGLQLQDIGAPIPSGDDGSGAAIAFLGSESSIEIKNCILAPHAITAFVYANNPGAAQKNASAIYVHDNKISYAGRGTIYGNTGYTVNDVRVYNNKWQGPGLTLASALYSSGGFHNDGLMVGCPANCTGTTPTMTNILFYNNLFNGSWEYCTAQYYSNGYTNNTSIYNNVFAIENNSSNGSPMQNFIQFNYNSSASDWGNINIYNNTFSSDSLLGYNIGVNKAVTFSYPSNNINPLYINIQNNIFSGLPIGIVVGSGTWNALNIDHNFYNLTTVGGYGYLDYVGGGSNTYGSVASACAAGYDCNSLGGDNYSSSYPGFASVPDGTTGSGNWQLLASSPAIGNGTNLSNIFDYDITNATRPSTGGWTMGAYEYNTSSTSGSSTATSATTLSVTKTGTGTGLVASSPAGISCGSNCSETVNSGTSVTLSSTPAADSFFAGWSAGGCSGTSGCTIDMSADTSVSAAFMQYITVSSPNGGEVWDRRAKYSIQWSYAGNPGPYVNIYLLQNGSVVRTIASGVPIGSNGSGSHNWEIPSRISPGSDYKVRITSTSNANYTDVSNANFTIQ